MGKTAADLAVSVPSVSDAPPAQPNSENVTLLHEKSHGSPSLSAKAEGVVVDSTPPPTVGIFELFRYATKIEIVFMIFGLFCAAGAGAMQPLMTVFFGSLTTTFVQFQVAVNNVNRNPSPEATAELAHQRALLSHGTAQSTLHLTFVGIGMLVGTMCYMQIWTTTGERISRRIREKYLAACLRQDIAYFDKLGAGEVATRIINDTNLIQLAISEKSALVVFMCSTFVTGFVIAYTRNAKLAGVLTVVVPAIAITGGIMNRRMMRLLTQSLHYISQSGTLAEEVISTIRIAKAYGSEGRLHGIFDGYLASARNMGFMNAWNMSFSMANFFLIIYSSYALAFYYGTTLILRNEITVGGVVACFLALLTGSFSLAMLSPELQAIAQGRSAAAKIFETIERVPPIDSADPGGLRPDSMAGVIEFENVSFSYPSRPDMVVLKDFSAKFELGQMSALVGTSGSGKSTIVALILRFYDPLSGVIKLDGNDIRTLNLKWLRTGIGYVGQEPVLFQDSVRANVEMGLIGTPYANASPEEKLALVKKACLAANAAEFITTLPQGYETNVGERGMLLSGGQKQRVAIARGIVGEPKILLLDEATSALPSSAEAVVQKALDAASVGRTTISIAHRLSTIRNAAQILVMGDGVVLERGTHDQLVSNEAGPYARLVEAQKLSKEQPIEADAAIIPTQTQDADPKQPGTYSILPSLGLARSGTRKSHSSKLEEGVISSEDKAHYGVIELFRRMNQLNRGARINYVIGMMSAACTGMVSPSFGILFAHTLSGLSAPRDQLRHNADRNALWFFVLSLCACVAFGLQTYSFTRAAAKLAYEVRSKSFSKLMEQDVAFFDEKKNSTGALTSDLADNAQKIQGLAGVTLGTILQSLSTLVGAAIIGLSYGWKLALVGIATVPLLISAGYVRLRVIVLKDKKIQAVYNESAQVALESAAAIRTVASLTREDECLRTYATSLEAPQRQALRSSWSSNAIYALTQAMSFWCIALIFYYGSTLLEKVEYNITQFFVCLMSIIFGSIQAGNAFSFSPDVSHAHGGATRVVRLLDSRPTIDSTSTGGKEISGVKGHVEFRNVFFRYPTRSELPVLCGLNLDIPAGSFVALVGTSGCGKSTCVQLLERFYDVAAGNILLDGEDIKTLNVKSLRETMALVSQEPTLYAGTIRHNILLGALSTQDVTDKQIEQVCRDANIHDFIQSLPKGLETEVGSKGTQLSGGQKQRIAIARALIRQPLLLLLDEATAALDSESEKVVQAALDNAARSKGRTTISIAHRLSTIQHADCIYVLAEGQVAQQGTYRELMAEKGGLFKEMVLLQNLSKAS